MAARHLEVPEWYARISALLRETYPEARAVYLNWFEGEPYFHLDRRGFAPIDTGMLPAFEYEVIEETDRYLVARHRNGIVTKALKEGTVRGTRMSMDQYLSFPITDRQSFRTIRKQYDPGAPVRYPMWWDEWVRIWRDRDYPLCLLRNAAFGLYSQLRSWLGTEATTYLFHDDPALLEEMIEFNTDFLLSLVTRALQEVRFDYFNFFEDFAGKGGPLLSPRIFRRFFLPSYRRSCTPGSRRSWRAAAISPTWTTPSLRRFPTRTSAITWRSSGS